MSNQAIKEYLLRILTFYKKSSKKNKTQLLDHAEEVCNLSRKHIIRRLNQGVEGLNKKAKSGAPRKYPKEELVPHIRYLWISMERITAKRMKEAFKDWLPFYRQCPGYLKEHLYKMSFSTVERYLKEIRHDFKKGDKGLSSTSPARYMKNKVPINTLDREINIPGYTQADTVAHCGTSLVGKFANTLTITDIHSTWTENRAFFSKKGQEVRDMFADINRSTPFNILAINTDSGSEFLNTPFFQYSRKKRILFTRSRPYKKNDNCYVEQKNYTHVRELFGYNRIESPALLNLMNDIYKNYWNPLQNYFLPSFKLKEKYRLGARVIKKYDRPQTPFKRLISSAHLPLWQKQRLVNIKQSLDPFELKKRLELKLSLFFKLLHNNKEVNYNALDSTQLGDVYL